MTAQLNESLQINRFALPIANANLYLVLPEIENLASFSEITIEESPNLIDVDTIPELYFSRLRALQEAKKTIENNRQLLREGKDVLVPLPVDPLGTARRVVTIKQWFGVNSPEYQESFAGLLLDSRTAVSEALRKNASEVFEETTQQFDPITKEYFSHGIAMSNITENGLSPIAEPEELDIRINDHVGERTNQTIPLIKNLGHLSLEKTVTVRGISECPDWAIEAYESDSKASHGGYVPAIKKLMIVDIRFDETNERKQQQVGLSGLYITHGVITTVLEQQGAIEAGKDLTKTQLHGKRFIDKSNAGILSFVELLDNEAARRSGKNIFMGEVVDEDYDKDYGSTVQEAEERRQRLASKPQMLAEYLISLEENQTDRWAAEALVDNFLKTMLLEVVRKDPSRAEDAFDKATANGFREVARLEELGRFEEALRVQAAVEKAAPAVSFCGAGSCGLEAVKPLSQEAVAAHSLGLGGELLHDTVRRCPNKDCKKKTVYYDKKGNKACTACGYNQVNGILSPVKSDKDKK
jgi:hypothetical protein